MAALSPDFASVRSAAGSGLGGEGSSALQDFRAFAPTSRDGFLFAMAGHSSQQLSAPALWAPGVRYVGCAAAGNGVGQSERRYGGKKKVAVAAATAAAVAVVRSSSSCREKCIRGAREERVKKEERVRVHVESERV